VRGHALGSFTIITVLLAKLFYSLLHPGLVPGEASRAQIVCDGLNPPEFSYCLRVKQLNFEPEHSWKEVGRCCSRVETGDLRLEPRNPFFQLLERVFRCENKQNRDGSGKLWKLTGRYGEHLPGPLNKGRFS
jgi:hypothetical protein